MPLDTRIALGVQPLQVADPLAQYGQVQNILAAQSQRQAAGTSNELAQVQLGQARMTLQQAQEAQNTVAQIMGTIGQHGGPADPMEAAMLMLKDPRRQVQDAGGHLLDSHQKVLAYQQQSQFLKDQSPAAAAAQPAAAAPAAFQYEESPAFGAQARTAPVDSSPAISMPVVRGMQTNALASATPTTAPVNALAAPQGKTAESVAAKINDGDRKYGPAAGWLKQRELLVKEFDQLIKGEGKLERMEVPQADGTIKYYTFDPRTGKTSEINAPGAATGMSAPNVRAQELKLQQDKFAYEKLHPGSTIHTVVNDDGTTSLLAVDKEGKATKVTLDDVEVKGVDTPAKRLKWEQDNPGKEIKEVTQADGTTKIMVVNKQTGAATPVTSEGQPLVGAKLNAPPATVAEYEYAKKPENGGFKGTYQQFITARAEAGRTAAQPSAPVAVVGADGKVKYVSREEAISKSMTPASAMEGLSPKDIQKREAAYPVAKQSTTTVSATMNQIDATVKRLLENEKGLNGITGLVYGNTPALTDAARRAAADLKQLKNLAFVQGLTELRAASSTGAAVGNVTNKEGDRFENLKASLETSQSFDDLKASLTRLQSQARATRDTVKQTFEDTYSYRNNTPAASGAVDTSNPLLKGK